MTNHLLTPYLRRPRTQLLGEPGKQAKEIFNTFQLCLNPIHQAALLHFDMAPRFILHGPPGTGKNTIVNTVVEDLSTNKIARPYWVNGSQLASSKYGETQKNAAALMSEANALSKEHPIVIIIDEAESIFASRTDTNDHRDGNRATTAFLTGLDQLSSRTGIIAMTNRLDMIDAAIQRRLHNHLFIDYPNKEIIRNYIQSANNQFHFDLTPTKIEQLCTESRTIAHAKVQLGQIYVQQNIG